MTTDLIEAIDRLVAVVEDENHRPDEYADAFEALEKQRAALPPDAVVVSAELLLEVAEAISPGDTFARFESMAKQFRKDTGMMAPGKDQPAAMGGPDYRTRADAWNEWLNKRADALANRLRAAAATKGGAGHG